MPDITLEWCIARWGEEEVMRDIKENYNGNITNYLINVEDWYRGMGD